MILIGMGFYGWVAAPLIEETDVLVVELRSLDQQLQLYQETEEQFLHLKEQVTKWESQVLRQEEDLGLEVPMNQVLSDMSLMAQKTGVSLVLWKPDEPNSPSLKQKRLRQLQLHIEGGYHNVARFLDQTQYLDKTLGVTMLKMQNVSTGLGRLTLQTIVSFVGYENGNPTTGNGREQSLVSKGKVTQGVGPG
jgi:Tfp pilus assembly protein PilO